MYLVDHDSIDIGVLVKVIEHFQSHYDRSKPEYENQRCLLYRDEKGRLYNLTLKNESSGLAGTWKSLLQSFSGLQAMIALTILTRVIACADPGECLPCSLDNETLVVAYYSAQFHVKILWSKNNNFFDIICNILSQTKEQVSGLVT